jgi:hypothetical protein
MREYKAHVADLAPLRRVDATAFEPDDSHSQQLCDFVIGLALAFNDLHDLLVTHDILNAAWPDDESTPTPELGEFNGMTTHLFRMHVATLHELLKLIEENQAVLKEPSFVKVMSNMHPEAQAAWKSAVAAATGTDAGTSKLTKFLHFARNKVASHYDRKEIRAGFKKAFAGAGRDPYVSRGTTFAKSRFYFADAAAQDYMRKKAEDLGVPESLLDAVKLIAEVAFAIHQLVFTFIETRGFSLQKL